MLKLRFHGHSCWEVEDGTHRVLIDPFLTGNPLVSPIRLPRVVLPEFVPARWWHHLFHNQSALLIKGALLFKPNTVVTSVPFHLE